MYSLFGYRQMAADRVRMDAYAAALRRAVRPGCTVLDIGAGTGVMSILAARFGAGRVFAVEPDRAIRVARQNVAENGYADRVECFEASSLELELPERADVIVSDLRGVLPLHERHVEVIADARARHLAQDGVIIPLRDTVWAAVVEVPDVYERYAALEFDGIALDAGRRVTSHLWTRTHLPGGAPLTDAARWVEIDYRTVEEANVRGSLRWEASRDGVAHGLGVWFDAELAEGIGYRGAPGGPELIYGHGFFPFPDPVTLRGGDRVEVDLRADLSDGEYLWSWNTTIDPIAGEGRRFQQSTLRGRLVSPEDLRAKRSRP